MSKAAVRRAFMSNETGELAVFGVAHVLLQQRVTAFGCNCEGAGPIRLCEPEWTELGGNINRKRRRIAFRVCGALQFPQPVKIVRSQIRVHDQLQSYGPVTFLMRSNVMRVTDSQTGIALRRVEHAVGKMREKGTANASSNFGKQKRCLRNGSELSVECVDEFCAETDRKSTRLNSSHRCISY